MPLRRNATWHCDTQFLSLSLKKKLHNFKKCIERDWVEWKIMMSNCDWEKKIFLSLERLERKRFFFVSEKLLNYETKKVLF